MTGPKPKLRQPSRFRKLLRVFALLLAVAWLLPLLVRVNFWQQGVGAALSEALHRPVRVGDIHLQLIGGLGFEISNVAVAEDPAFGVEPFARAESLRARVALSSLWRGRLEFSSIELISPSFNVVRSLAGRWNVELFGGGSSHAGVQSAAATADSAVVSELPRLRVQDGRINFKFGEYKKAYCIESVNLELTPPASPRQPWKFRFEGMPARTDLPFHPASPFFAHGEFGPISSELPKETGVPLHVDWSIENALLAELFTVVSGQDFGVHGMFTIRGHATGTTSLFRVSAEGKIDDLHRWDLLPDARDSSLRAGLAGIVDLSGDSVQLTSLTIPLGTGSVVLRGSMEDIFHQPQPRMEVELLQVPLSSLAALVPRFTTRFAHSFQASGKLQGRIWSEGFSGPMSGTVEVSRGSFRLTESSPPLRFASFPVHLAGSKGLLGPVRLLPNSGSPAEVSLQWDASKHSYLLRLGGEGISLPAVLRLAAAGGWGTSLAKVPQGELALHLDLASRSAAPPRLTGWAHISDAVVERRGVSEPLRISAAHLRFQRDQMDISSLAAELGPVEVHGNITVYRPATTPDGSLLRSAFPDVEFTLHSSEVDIAKIATLFVAPRQRGYFLGFGKEDPPAATWLDSKLRSYWNSLQARGTLRVDTSRYRGWSLKNVAAFILLHDRRLEIPAFTAEQAGGTARGSAALNFEQQPLSFRLESHFNNLNLDKLTGPSERWTGLVSGTLRGMLHVESSGRSGEELLSQLNGSGQAVGKRVVLRVAPWAETLGIGDTDELHIDSFRSNFRIGKKMVSILEMRVLPARVLPGPANPLVRPPMWRIRGEVGFDRRLELTVEQDSEGRTSEWAGTLADPQLIRSISNATTANAINTPRSSDASLPPN